MTEPLEMQPESKYDSNASPPDIAAVNTAGSRDEGIGSTSSTEQANAPPTTPDSPPPAQANVDIAHHLANERFHTFHETREQMLQRLIISTAVGTRAEVKGRGKEKDMGKRMNQAEHSFSLLGHIVGDLRTFKGVDDIDTSSSEPLADFSRNFSSHEPKPRILSSGGSQKAVYDNRQGGTGDTNPTPLGQSVFELQAVYAKVRGDDGRVQYVCSAQYNDETGKLQTTLPLLVREDVFIQSYILAQHSIIQNGLKEDGALLSGISANSGIKDVVATVTRNAANYAPHSQDATSTIDLSRDITDETLAGASAGLMLKKDDLQALVTRLKANRHLDNNVDLPAIEQFIQDLDEGQDVPAQSALEVLLSAGRPGMIARIEEIDLSLKQLESNLSSAKPADKPNIQKEIDKLKEERRLTRVVVRRQKEDNPLYGLIMDLDEGRADPETAKAIFGKIKNIGDPKEFFELKAEDLQDENSLLSHIAKHYLKRKGMTDEEQKSWISNFFKLHAGDIGLMLIYVLIQTASGVVQTAAKQ